MRKSVRNMVADHAGTDPLRLEFSRHVDCRLRAAVVVLHAVTGVRGAMEQ